MANDFFNQIKDDLAEYGKALGNVGKWRLIGIISRVLGLFLLILTVAFCVLALFAFGAVAVIDVLAQDMPVWAAALIICGVYVLLILILNCSPSRSRRKKNWRSRPWKPSIK